MESVRVYCAVGNQFLGAFAKLRRATLSFLMSVQLSVRMEKLGSQLPDSHEIGYLLILWKACRESSSFIKI